MIEEILQQIGLTSSEVKVYMALLELGESKTGAILKESGLNSGKIYEILDSLQKKGLVSYIVRSGVKYFSPADPSRVLDYLDEKKQAVVSQEENYSKILPTLMKKVSAVKTPVSIEVFTGLKGMRTAWAKEFNYSKKETLYVLGVNSSGKYAKGIWDYFANVHRPKRDRLGYKVKKLLSSEARSERSSHEKNAEVRYLPYGSLVSIGVIGNLTIIGIFSGEPINITIESCEVASNFKKQFDALWKIGED